MQGRGSHCFLDLESGGDCLWDSPNRRVWYFQVYCVQHPVLVTINRETEEEYGESAEAYSWTTGNLGVVLHIVYSAPPAWHLIHKKDIIVHLSCTNQCFYICVKYERGACSDEPTDNYTPIWQFLQRYRKHLSAHCSGFTMCTLLVQFHGLSFGLFPSAALTKNVVHPKLAGENSEKWSS